MYGFNGIYNHIGNGAPTKTDVVSERLENTGERVRLTITGITGRKNGIASRVN
jgi:hypothetical protein